MQTLKKASVGRPLTKFGRSIYPIYMNGPVRSEEIRGATTGSLVFTELPGASVPDVSVENQGSVAVLLPAGMVIIGGMQNRILNTSLVVGPRERLTVPVSCVEQGRWGGSRQFQGSGSIAPSTVRDRMHRSIVRGRDGVERAQQQQVWDAVDRHLLDRGAQNTTHDLEYGRQDAGDERRRRKIAKVIADGPLPGQCGVAVMHGSKVVSIEIFASPQLLADHWEQLIRAIFEEADPVATVGASADGVLAELERLTRSTWRIAPSTGRGTTHAVVDERFTGRTLEDAGAIVHASMFAIAG